MFGTLGVMLAVVLALALTVAQARANWWLLAVAARGRGRCGLPDHVARSVGPFKRVTPVVGQPAAC